jgi:hypothetical protein
MKRAFQIIATSLVIMGFALYIGGCSNQSPMQYDKFPPVENAAPGLAKASYPQATSLTLRLLRLLGIYNGGMMEVPNGSSFTVAKGSLIPNLLRLLRLPLAVTLTMQVDLDPANDFMVYTFGPSGSKFDPPAEAWFDWSDLGGDDVTVYYIDPNGNRIEQTPEQIDYENKRLLLHIHHFSRYAVARSR